MCVCVGRVPGTLAMQAGTYSELLDSSLGRLGIVPQLDHGDGGGQVEDHVHPVHLRHKTEGSTDHPAQGHTSAAHQSPSAQRRLQPRRALPFLLRERWAEVAGPEAPCSTWRGGGHLKEEQGLLGTSPSPVGWGRATCAGRRWYRSRHQ